MEAGPSRPKRDRSESPRRASGQEESSGGSGARTKKHKSPQVASPVGSPSPERQQLSPTPPSHTRTSEGRWTSDEQWSREAQPMTSTPTRSPMQSVDNEDQWSREAQPTASTSSPTRSPTQSMDNDDQWSMEAQPMASTSLSSSTSLLSGSDPLPFPRAPMSRHGRWTADAIRDDSYGVYQIMYQQQPREPPAVVARPRQMAKKTVKQQPKQVVVWQKPNPLGPFTFAERGLDIDDEIDNSHWPEDQRAVTYYRCTRNDKLKVAVRVVDEGFLKMDIPHDWEYWDSFIREWSYLKTLQCKYLADVYDKFPLKTAIKNSPKKWIVVQEWFDDNLIDAIDYYKEDPMTPSDVKTADRPHFQLLPSGLDTRIVKIWMGQIAQAIEYLHTKGIVHNAGSSRTRS